MPSRRKVILAACLTGDDPTRGEWCELCALPSAVKMKLTLVAVGGVRRCGAVLHCFDCHAEWLED